MSQNTRPDFPAEQIALWADRLRDLAAAGLIYAQNIYDKDRYEVIQEIALEMVALATAQPVDAYEPLKTTVFSRMSPVLAANAAVINAEGEILLMLREDVNLWAMPGGMIEVGETPAQAAAREVFEETGVRCKPLTLVGVYDSRIWDVGASQHILKLTYLCEPSGETVWNPSHAHETLETGWFAEGQLPEDLYSGHIRRIHDAYRVRDGRTRAHFD